MFASLQPHGLCNLPGSSVHGILQAGKLVWVDIPFSRDLPNPRIKPGSPALQADSLPSEPPGKPRDTKGERQQDRSEGGVGGGTVETHSSGGATHKQVANYSCRGSSSESETHLGLLGPGVLHGEDKLSEHLALKATGAYFQESHRAVGKRYSTYKGCTQNHTHLETQGIS